MRAGRACAAVVVVLAISACASNPPPRADVVPKFPTYPVPDIPPAVRIAADLRARHDLAWRRLQAGDLGGAGRDYSFVLKRAPDFYPSRAGLGFAHLADREFKAANAEFTAALDKNDRYLPAWLGRAEAEIGLGHDAEAIAAMERILVLDPRRDAVRTRLELLRFRQVQELIDQGRKARLANRFDDAAKALESAMKLSPSSTVIFRELVLVETKRGNLDAAEAHARKVVQLEPADAEGLAALAAVLESREKYREAAAAYARAVTLDPRDEWRIKVDTLREKADLAAVPAAFRGLATAATVTRADVAAYIGLRLDALLDRAPKRPTAVATDIRNHWAAPWILPVTRAGVMEIYENHTFQPAATMKRGDLAQAIAELLALATSDRPADLARWRAARPRFPDLAATNVFYRSAALAVAAGALGVDAAGRFEPTTPASGPDLTNAVARIAQLSR